MAALDWSQCDAVESIPGKVSGAWLFKGTRLPVDAVFVNLEGGVPLEEIPELFDISIEEIDAVLRFIIQSLAKEPAYGSGPRPEGWTGA